MISHFCIHQMYEHRSRYTAASGLFTCVCIWNVFSMCVCSKWCIIQHELPRLAELSSTVRQSGWHCTGITRGWKGRVEIKNGQQCSVCTELHPAYLMAVHITFHTTFCISYSHIIFCFLLLFIWTFFFFLQFKVTGTVVHFSKWAS